MFSNQLAFSYIFIFTGYSQWNHEWYLIWPWDRDRCFAQFMRFDSNVSSLEFQLTPLAPIAWCQIIDLPNPFHQSLVSFIERTLWIAHATLATLYFHLTSAWGTLRMVAFDTAAPLNGQKDVADILQVFIWIVFDCSESRYFRRRRFSEELFSDLPSRLLGGSWKSNAIPTCQEFEGFWMPEFAMAGGRILWLHVWIGSFLARSS